MYVCSDFFDKPTLISTPQSLNNSAPTQKTPMTTKLILQPLQRGRPGSNIGQSFRHEVEESELTRRAADFVNESTGKITTEDGTEVIVRHLLILAK